MDFLLFRTIIIVILLIKFVYVYDSNEGLAQSDQKIIIAERYLHKSKMLDKTVAQKLAKKVSYGEFRIRHLYNLLRVRVPGTNGHRYAKEFIISRLRTYGWTVEFDKFVDVTPLGNKTFTNIIATLNPSANRRLALAAHYDTKILPSRNGKWFIGATDSAVSCAMLLHFAKLLREKSKGDGNKVVDVSPMLLFIDGEEAFVKWSKQDSLYGSRHLAQTMANWPHHNKSLATSGVSMLESMDAFILLDLIGAKHGQFVDMYSSTSHLYDNLKDVERRLKTLGEITKSYSYFYGKRQLYIQDDQVPFYQRNVPILHLISLPYPIQWHNVTDDEKALDKDSIVDLLKIFDQFLFEYLHLSY